MKLPVTDTGETSNLDHKMTHGDDDLPLPSQREARTV